MLIALFLMNLLIMKAILILFISLLISACELKTQTQHSQQQFICQALIQGYLKTQQLMQYELQQSIEMQHSTVYIYQQPNLSSQILNIPPIQQIKFDCSYPKADQYQIFISSTAQQKRPLFYLNIAQ